MFSGSGGLLQSPLLNREAGSTSGGLVSDEGDGESTAAASQPGSTARRARVWASQPAPDSSVTSSGCCFLPIRAASSLSVPFRASIPRRPNRKGRADAWSAPRDQAIQRRTRLLSVLLFQASVPQSSANAALLFEVRRANREGGWVQDTLG